MKVSKGNLRENAGLARRPPDTTLGITAGASDRVDHTTGARQRYRTAPICGIIAPMSSGEYAHFTDCAVAGWWGWLKACSVGTAPGDRRRVGQHYKLQTNYQDAIATRRCRRALPTLVGQGGYRVVGELDDNAHRLVRVVLVLRRRDGARGDPGAIKFLKPTSISACGAEHLGIPTLRCARSWSCTNCRPAWPICRAIRRRPRKSGACPTARLQSPPGRRWMILNVAVALAPVHRRCRGSLPSQKAIDAPRRRHAFR